MQSGRTKRVAGRANTTPKTHVAYFAAVPEPGRATLKRVRDGIRSVLPAGATETISYGIPTFNYKGALVAIAAFSDHCSLFPMGSSAIKQFAADLKPYRTSKGTIQFPFDKPLPATLVKKIVKACVARNEAKRRGMKAKK